MPEFIYQRGHLLNAVVNNSAAGAVNIAPRFVRFVVAPGFIDVKEVEPRAVTVHNTGQRHSQYLILQRCAGAVVENGVIRKRSGLE